MAKSSRGDALSKVIELLQPLEDLERERVIRALLSFFNLREDFNRRSGADEGFDGGAPRRERMPGTSNAKNFFDQKEPKSKIEELSVSSRCRVVTSSENHDSEPKFDAR